MRLLGGKRKLTWLKRAQTILWPKKGFLRLLNYLWHRIGRLGASPYSIAAGLASGVAISFTPLIGFHILLGITLAWLIRGNIIAAIIGTLAGNPWSFPLIWLLTYHSGVYLYGGNDNTPQTVHAPDLWGYESESPESLFAFLENRWENLEPVLVPMLIGSIPFVIFCWLGVFAMSYLMVAKYRERRERKKTQKPSGEL